MIAKVFPTLMVVGSALAAVVYALNRDWRHAAYWAFATGITATVTYW